ncbi:hypothetical protein H4R19_006350 [Coemansia spiralis]|nr:hypothetical protein H4R19_006350 [Coemansia spiralis]
MASIPPSQTLYIRNLNDKIHKDTLKHALYGLCVAYGRVLDIVALKTIKMRGQAFVAFEDITAATAALRQLHGRQVFGRPMRIEYALSKSNMVAVKDGTFRADQPHKHMSAAQRKQQLGIAGDGAEKRRQSTDGADSAAPAAKRRVTERAGSDSDRDDGSSDDDDIGPAPPPQNAAADADASPSATLFVTSLPAAVADEQLAGLFQQYVGFKEVRRIPGRADMAFVDYATVDAAAAARSVLDGFKVADGQAMSVEFSR